MRYFLVLLCSTLFLTGCGAGALLHCADGAIPRPVTEKSYTIYASDLQGLPLAKTRISCRKAYDAQCSVRGNSYRYSREQTGDTTFVAQLTNGDSVEVTFPSCENLLEERTINASHFGRRYVVAETGERRNNLIYVYSGADFAGLNSLPEGYVYFEPNWSAPNRKPVHLPLPFRFAMEVE